MFLELCKRRNVGIKYQRYASAMTAAAIYNVNRGSADDPVVEAFDFLRSAEATERREMRLKAKKFVKDALGGLPFGTTRAKFLETRLKVLADLRASGHDDAEQIVDECFPSLKPKDDECQK
jgi:hypothetical protein